jgi:hemoglobin
MGATLIERYGRPKVAEIVTAFYGRVLKSPRLSEYFRDVPMTGLINHQARFMAMTMGDPIAFTSEDIRQAHQELGISPEEFDEMLGLLESTLLEFGVVEDDTERIVAAYRARRSDVVGDTPTDSTAGAR